jgi:vacuolar-type H+-ATPase subunit E/Vma4
LEEGNIESLLEYVINKVINEFKDTVEELRKDAHELLDDAYKNTKNSLVKELSDLYENYVESVNNLRSLRQYEIKIKTQEKKAEIVDLALKEVEKKIFYELDKEEKKIIYEAILSKLKESIKLTNGEIHIEKEDKDLVSKIIKKKLEDSKEKIKIIDDLPSGTGGIKFVSQDGSTVYDFTLKKIFELSKFELASIVYNVLFGGEEK